jgi:effector-binding domain-containing protein
MKLFKGIAYFLFIMFMAVLLAAVFAPSNLVVSRKVSIDAPVAVVFAQVADTEKWQKWDAWYTENKGGNRSFKGSVGDTEYGLSWSPKKQPFQPYGITLGGVKNNEEIAYTMLLTLLKQKVTVNGKISFRERNGHTEMEWTVKSDQHYPFKIVNYFIEKSLGPNFGKSLMNLKFYTETRTLEELGMPKNGVSLQVEHGVSYALLQNELLPIVEMPDFFRDGYQDIYKYLKRSNTKPKGPPSGLFYKWDYTSNEVNAAAAVPIAAAPVLTDSTVQLEGATIKLGSNHVAAVHNGGYASLAKTHLVLQTWMENHQKQYQPPAVEQYLKGPLDEADTSLHVTRVTYFFK